MADATKTAIRHPKMSGCASVSGCDGKDLDTDLVWARSKVRIEYGSKDFDPI